MTKTDELPLHRRQRLHLAARTLRHSRRHHPRGHRVSQKALRDNARRYRRPGVPIKTLIEIANTVDARQRTAEALKRADLANRMAFPLGTPERHGMPRCHCCRKVHATRRRYWSCIIHHHRGEGSDGAVRLSVANAVLEHFRPCLNEEYSSWDNAWRGSALTHELLGYDLDQEVAVVRAERRFRLYRNGWMNRHTTCFLVGFNEVTGQPFRHPVSSRIFRDEPEFDNVRAAQKWMWQITDEQLDSGCRQGDVFLAPVKRPRGEPIPEAVLGGSHRVRGREVRRDAKGRIFALDPRLAHLKRQHGPVRLKGWFQVCLAREEAAWDFAERIGD